MPALPKVELYGNFPRASSSSHLFPLDDIKTVLSDALLSFSPLAVLVGAGSAKALADRVTNVKQSFVACVAPVGALGMMGTVAKGANLVGIKEMLGVGGQDIKDAARALGCAAIAGDVIPQMDENGVMASNGIGHSLDQAASAIVKQRWQTGSRCRLDLCSLRRVPATFVAGTMSGRLMWEIHSQVRTMEMIRNVQEALSIPLSLDHSTTDVFDKMNKLDGGVGTIELHWPAPAMPLETNPFVIYLYGCFFVASFISVAFLAGSRILFWQSPISSGLLVGGQGLLILGHVAAQYTIKSQRETLQVQIAIEKSTHWLLVDRTRFTSAAALRPFSVPHRSSILPRFHFSNKNPHAVPLGQYHRFSSKYITTWRASLILLSLILGFVAFYVGGRSSDVKTVAIYIILFILANLTKGPVVLYANKPHYTRLNNFGHEDIVSWKDSGDLRDARPPSKPINRIKRATITRDNSGFFKPLPSTNHDDVDEVLDTFSKPFRIYSKFFIRDRHATDMFCFSSMDEWTLAAHVIGKAVKPIQSSDLEHENNPDIFLQIPLYLWDETEEFHGLLLLAIDKIRPEHLFWSVGMEVVSILMGNFGSTLLCSQDKAATDTSFLAAFVFTCVRMLLSEHVYCGDALLPCKLRGARSLMRAIEDTTRSTKEPSDTMPELLALLNRAAEAAKGSRGVILKSKKMLAYEDVRFSRLMDNEAPSILVSLKKVDGCAAHLRQVEQLLDSQQPPEVLQLPQELQELRVMLMQLTGIENSALPLNQISQLLDKIQRIGDLSKADQIRQRQQTLWEEAQEELKDELQDLALVEPYQRQERWSTQEILRRRQRHRQAELQQKLPREKAAERDLRWEVHCLMAHLGASLQGQQNLLRERLRQELRRELMSVSASANARQLQLEQEIIRIQQHIITLEQELRERKDLDEPEEYMLRLRHLRFQQFYLDQELQEVLHDVKEQATNPVL